MTASVTVNLLTVWWTRMETQSSQRRRGRKSPGNTLRQIQNILPRVKNNLSGPGVCRNFAYQSKIFTFSEVESE